MKHLPLILAASTLLLGPALLAGCDDDEHEHHRVHTRSERHDPGDGAIGLEGDTVVIEAGGENRLARVGADGSLRIGEQLIDSSPEAQAALKTYGAAAVAMKTHAIALGRSGAEFGFDTLKDVMRGLFDGGLDQVGDKAREGAHTLVASVRELCARMETMHSAQQTAALAVPAFAPYAVLDADQVRECFEEIDEELKEHPGAGQPAAPVPTPSSAPAGIDKPAPPDAA